MKKTWKLRSKYNFGTIEVGGSMSILAPYSRVSAAVCMYGKRNNMKFSTAKSGNSVIVWRLN